MVELAPTPTEAPSTREVEQLPVDVLVVAHDSGPLLMEAVESALADLPPQQITILDAESVDGSVQAVKDRHPSVNVIPVENRGFATSNNQGLSCTAREYVLLLNPDAILAFGAIAALLDRAASRPRAAVVGAKIVNPDGSLQADSYGRFPTLPRLLLLHGRRFSRRLIHRSSSPGDFSSLLSVDWVTGACMLVRRRAVAEVGGMDERFFLYLEDVDWCLRFRRAGWEVYVEPAAVCVHHLGRSGSGEGIGRRAYRRSLLHYARIHRLPGLALLALVQLLKDRAGLGR